MAVKKCSKQRTTRMENVWLLAASLLLFTHSTHAVATSPTGNGHVATIGKGDQQEQSRRPVLDKEGKPITSLLRKSPLLSHIYEHYSERQPDQLEPNHQEESDEEHGVAGAQTSYHQPVQAAALINGFLGRSSKPLVLSFAGATVFKSIVSRLWNQPTKRAFFFWRKAGPIVVHYKFTQWWLKHIDADQQRRDETYRRLHERYSQPSLAIILHLKGFYVKLGQVLAARPDFIAREYVEVFSTVQDAVPQQPFDEVREMVDVALRKYRGLSFDDVFESMDPVALGSASIGQCHRGVLKAGMEWYDQLDKDEKAIETVAVKVMHPTAKAMFQHDFQVFRWLCRVALPGWRTLLNELERQVMTEFDYRREADNLAAVRKNMEPYKRLIVVPQPIHFLTCRNVLVMEMLDGIKLAEHIEQRIASAVDIQPSVARSFIQKRREALLVGEKKNSEDEEDEADVSAFSQLMAMTDKEYTWGERLVSMIRLYMLTQYIRKSIDTLCDVHGHQIFIDGLFQGDPHPGNWLALSDGRLGLIDYGSTKELSDAERRRVARVVAELGTGPHANSTLIANNMRSCGFRTKYDGDDTIIKYAKLFFDSDTEAKEAGCVTPQHYLMMLQDIDPLEKVPDEAVFVARASFMFRGMGSFVKNHVKTASKWKQFADKALAEA